MKTVIKGFTVLLFSFIIAGCGGGAGNGSAGNNSSSARAETFFPRDSRLAYANDKNAQEVTNLIIGYNTNDIVPRNKITGKSAKMSVLKLAISELKEFRKSSSLKKSNKVIDQSDYCESGRLYRDELSDGSIDFEYQNCSRNGFRYDGTVNKHRYGNKLDITYKSSFEIKNESDNSTILVKKDSKISLEQIGDNEFKIYLNLITTQDGKSNGFEHTVFIYEGDSNNATMYQTDGNIYIDNLQEYVVFDKNYNMQYTPFVYSDGTIIDGEAHYKMRGTTLIITVNNGEAAFDY